MIKNVAFVFSVLLFSAFAAARPAAAAEAETWLTQAGDKPVFLEKQAPHAFTESAPRSRTVVEVDPDDRRQPIDGFGGNLPESAVMDLNRLSAPLRERALTLLFDKEKGAGFNYVRALIGSSEFADPAKGDYTYDDTPNDVPDPDFKYFSIARDQKSVAVLKEAQKLNPDLKIMLSPWSPPAWMKSNKKLRKGYLLPDHRQDYARYLVKAVQAYRNEGLNIVSMTVQNEALITHVYTPSSSMTAKDQGTFIRDFLTPELKKNGLSIKIYVFDHNYEDYRYPLALLNDPTVRPLIAGVAYHCYEGRMEQMKGSISRYPDVPTLQTECSGRLEDKDFDGSFQWWMHNQVVGAMALGTSGALSWSMILDEKGGPHIGGCRGCRGMITADIAKQELTPNPEYYALAHASKFLAEGAVRIGVSPADSLGTEKVAFQNPDKSVVLIVRNPRPEPATFAVSQAPGCLAFDYELPAKAAVTFKWPGSERCRARGAVATAARVKSLTAEVWTSAKDTALRLSASEPLNFEDSPQPLETEPFILVDSSKTFQTMIGIGAALTDAAADVFGALPKDKQAEVMRAFFDPKDGIGYTLARTNMNSCDFSSATYSYVADGDKDLKTFDIAHDKQNRIPMIKQAMAAAGGKLTLFLSPWSPPAWMKDNANMLHGGKLEPEYYQSWANYYAKFIRAYEKEGVPIWGLTVQNEPMASQRWESCVYTAQDEKNFLKNYLGPTLAREGLGDRKILVWDHNRDLMYQRASVIFDDPEAAKYAYGLAYHWYESFVAGQPVFNNVRHVAESYPDKVLFFSEGTQENFDAKRLDDWSLGERYGREMIRDFNNGTAAWTDWNMLLDGRGGPNHVGNYCFAALHVDAKTKELHYTNIYQYMGHFSKFVRPGAKRVAAVPSRENLLTTAFLNTDGSLVVIVMNQGRRAIDYSLWIHGQAAPVTSQPHSIATIVLR